MVQHAGVAGHRRVLDDRIARDDGVVFHLGAAANDGIIEDAGAAGHLSGIQHAGGRRHVGRRGDISRVGHPSAQAAVGVHLIAPCAAVKGSLNCWPAPVTGVAPAICTS